MGDEYVYGLSDYLRVFRERRRTVALVVAAVFVLSLAITFARGEAAPVESASTRPSPTPTTPKTSTLFLHLEDLSIPGGTITVDPEFERARLTSPKVLRRAARETGVKAEALARAILVEINAEGRILVINAEDIGRIRGDKIGEAVAKAYLSLRLDPLRARLQTAIKTLRRRVAALEATTQDGVVRIVGALRIAALHDQIAELEALRSSAIAGEVVTALGAAPTPEPTVRVEVEEAAEEPAVPVVAPTGPPYLRNGVAGLVLGMIFGAAVALLQDAMDPRFRTEEELERRLGIPLMASLPADDEARQHAAESILAQISPRGLSSLALLSLADRGTERQTADRLLGALEDAVGFERPDIIAVSSVTEPGDYLSKAGAADAVLLVIDRDEVTREDAVRELGKLQRSGAEVLGTILA